MLETVIIKNKFGHCEYAFEEDYVHIFNLFIYPEYRQQGKAREILQMTINEIRKRYNGVIQIVVNSKDESIDKRKLAAFYKNIGLEVFDYYG